MHVHLGSVLDIIKGGFVIFFKRLQTFHYSIAGATHILKLKPSESKGKRKHMLLRGNLTFLLHHLPASILQEFY